MSRLLAPPGVSRALPSAPPRPAFSLARLLTATLDGPGWTALRVALDMLVLAAVVALTIIAGEDPVDRLPLVVLVPAGIACSAAAGLYRRQRRLTALDGFVPLARAIGGACTLSALACAYLTAPLPPAALVYLAVTAFSAVGAVRVAASAAQRASRVRFDGGAPTLIVGSGIVGDRVARRLAAEPSYGLKPIGFLDIPLPVGELEHILPLLGGPDDLDRVVAEHGVRHVVLAYAAIGDRAILRIAHRAQALGLELTVVPRLFDAINDRGVYETIGGLPLVGLRLTEPRSAAFLVKHTLDRVIAATALLVLAPLLAAIALGVRLSSRGPVIFRQRRVGRDGMPFDLLKFRTMTGEPDPAFVVVSPAGVAAGGVEGVDRRTAIGRLLRKTSLDELPQLVNVLRGEMSLVGPRPERPELVERYAGDLDRYPERHRVRAGITGLAQSHGLRGKTSLADRIELDNAYIEHWSLGLDMKIVLRTFATVLRNAE